MQSWDAGRYSRDFTTLLTYLITFAESSIWVLWPVHSRSLYNEMKMSIPYNFNLSFTVKIHYIFKFSHIIFQLVYSFQSLVGILKKSFTALQVCKQSSAIVCGKNKNKAKKKKNNPQIIHKERSIKFCVTEDCPLSSKIRRQKTEGHLTWSPALTNDFLVVSHSQIT